MVITVKETSQETSPQEVVVNRSPNDPEIDTSDFWDDDERRLLKDIQKIECSSMNFAEKKYYTQLCETIYSLTSFYKHYESVAQLLWNRNKTTKKIKL